MNDAQQPVATVGDATPALPADGAPMAQPRLVGELVRLRPHTVADIDAIVERCLDPVTVAYTTVPVDYTHEMAESYLAEIIPARPDMVSWAIDVDGAYAGTIDLRRDDVDAGGGNLGYVTHPAFRGRGVMSEAVRLVVDYALDTLGWELVQWKAVVGNFGSAKAVWRTGFPLPIHVPALLFERGEARDGWVSTIGRGDPRTPVAPWDEVLAILKEHVGAARWRVDLG
jgi:RimJ/RimL family protein N-acetyltransferase